MPEMRCRFVALVTHFRRQHIMRNICFSFDMQLHLSDRTNGLIWHFDLLAGTLSFGNQHHWRTQVLGKESEAAGTWVWAWANIEGNVPDHTLAASLTLRAYGEQHGIPILTTPQFPLDQIDCHRLALLASSICEASAYYRCPFEGGALFVLIMDDNFPKCTDPPLQRVATVFPQAIASLEIPDHKLALTGYLDHYGLNHEQDGDKIVVRENGVILLTATFDEQNRLTNLEAKMTPSAPAPKGESWDGFLLRRMMGW